MNPLIITIIVLGVLVIVLAIIVGFLLNMLLKMFRIMQRHLQTNHGRTLTFDHDATRKPGMYNIALQGNKPFTTVIGFDQYLFGRLYYNYYAFLNSGEKHSIVFSTYLGKKGATFKFLTNCDVGANNLSVSSNAVDQDMLPHAVYKPNWWQTWFGI